MRGRVNPGQTWRLLGEPREQGVQEDLPGGPSWPPAHGFFEDGAFPFLTGGCGLCAHTVPSASRGQRLEGPSICGTGSLAWLGRQQAGRLAGREAVLSAAASRLELSSPKLPSLTELFGGLVASGPSRGPYEPGGASFPGGPEQPLGKPGVQDPVRFGPSEPGTPEALRTGSLAQVQHLWAPVWTEPQVWAPDHQLGRGHQRGSGSTGVEDPANKWGWGCGVAGVCAQAGGSGFHSCFHPVMPFL